MRKKSTNRRWLPWALGGAGLLWALLSPLQATPETTTVLLSGTGPHDAVPWQFSVSAGRRAGEQTTLPVPSCWELHGFGRYDYGLVSLASQGSEVGTYRRLFAVPVEWTGRRIEVEFDGVMTDATVRINGTLAGPTHQGAFYRFRYDITSLVRWGATDNEIEVVVAKKSANTSVNEAERTADYWIFGGIFRPVRLLVHPAERIAQVALDPRADGSLRGRLQLAGLADAATLATRVRGWPDGALVAELPVQAVPAGTTELTLSPVTIANLTPWTMEAPVLYTVELALERAGQILHRTTVRTGFRTIEVRPRDGLYLNGVKIRLQGFNRHAFRPASGRTLSPADDRADVETLLALNSNAVRMSHYPPDKPFLEACDERGLLVVNELAGWQSPGYDDATAARMVREMVERDVNHPSIVLWANSNEGGWNLNARAVYPLHDPQGRAVIHPGSNFSGPIDQGGFDTTHYPTYTTLVSKLAGQNNYLPTEFLHGLYDGGHGAGLADFWSAIRASPRGSGGFLWVFADEGVVRTDRGGALDTDGNHAPDGIVGPFGEPEPGFDSVRDIWSPLQLAQAAPAPATLADLAATGGTLPLSWRNDFYFVSLAAAEVTWQWVRLPGVGSALGSPETIVASGPVDGLATIAPGQTATVGLVLPPAGQPVDLLRLSATRADGGRHRLRQWSWPVASPAATFAAERPPVSPTAPAATVTPITNGVRLAAASTVVDVSATTGRIASWQVGAVTLPLTNGPRLAEGTATFSSLTSRTEVGGIAVAEATYTGDLARLTYRLHPDGALEVAWRLTPTGARAHLGLTWDMPPTALQSLRWRGDGPHRVWKNRLDGVTDGVWEKTANNAIPGQRWTTDPVFRGHHANLRWARLQLTDGPLFLLTDVSGLFLQVLKPSNGSSPLQATFAAPPGDLGLLYAIPAHGNKFHSPTAGNLGPSGAPTTLLSGPLEGRALLWMEAPGPGAPPVVSRVEAVAPGRTRVVFSRAMAPAPLTTPAHYAFSPSLAVHGVQVESAQAVLVDHQPIAGGATVTLTLAEALADTVGQPLATPRAWSVVGPTEAWVRWPLDEAPGGVSPDLAATPPAAGLPLTLRGAAAIGPSAGRGGSHGALDLGGTTGAWAEFTSPALEQWTIALWLRRTGGGSSLYPRLWSLGDDNAQLLVDLSTQVTAPSFGVNLKGVGDWRAPAGAGSATGVWQHVAVAFAATSGAPPRFWLNGQPTELSLLTSSPGTYGVGGRGALGNRPTDGARPWQGQIDEVVVFQRVVTNEEVAELAAAPAPQGFAAWASGFVGLGEAAQDTDCDGLSNLVEFALGSSPVLPAATSPLHVAVNPAAEPVFRFWTARHRQGLQLALETQTTGDPAGGAWQVLPRSHWRLYRTAADRVQWEVTLPPASVGSTAVPTLVRVRATLP